MIEELNKLLSKLERTHLTKEENERLNVLIKEYHQNKKESELF